MTWNPHSWDTRLDIGMEIRWWSTSSDSTTRDGYLPAEYFIPTQCTSQNATPESITTPSTTKQPLKTPRCLPNLLPRELLSCCVKTRAFGNTSAPRTMKTSNVSRNSWKGLNSSRGHLRPSKNRNRSRWNVSCELGKSV